MLTYAIYVQEQQTTALGFRVTLVENGGFAASWFSGSETGENTSVFQGDFRACR